MTTTIKSTTSPPMTTPHPNALKLHALRCEKLNQARELDKQKEKIYEEERLLALVEILWDKLSRRGNILTARYQWPFDDPALLSQLRDRFVEFERLDNYTVEEFKYERSIPTENGYYYWISVTLKLV